MGVKLGQKWAVKDGNLLASNQVGSRFFNKEFDFSRASNGTYVDRDGLLKTAELYNLVEYSEDFTDSSWVKEGGATIEENIALSPNKNNNASYLKAPVTTNNTVRVTYTFSSTSLQTYVGSIFVKKDNVDYIRMLSTGATSSTLQAFYNVSNGTLGSVGTPSKATIEDYGNGWFRLGLIIDAVNTSSSATFRVQLAKADGDVINNFDGTEKNLIYGAQLVEGTEPLDYQYTNGLQGLPRISFEDGVGHLLLEPQRSNLLLQSNSFDTTWVKFATPTLTSGQSGIYGSNDAWLLTNGGSSYIYQNITTGAATYSIYAKSGDAGTGNILYLFCDGVGGRYFDLANGTLSTEILSGLTDSQIESVGNGWYRCSITFPNSTIVRIYAGESTSTDSIYIQHAQLESGSYPTSIIETTTTSVTRLADVCNNSGSAQDFNSEEGVLYWEGKLLYQNQIQFLANICDGTQSNFVWLHTSSAGLLQTSIYSGGIGTGAINVSSIDLTSDYNKIAVKYKTNELKLFLNGSLVGTDTSVTMPIGLNELTFERGDSSVYHLNGKVRNLQVFTEALSDEELQQLTT